MAPDPELPEPAVPPTEAGTVAAIALAAPTGHGSHHGPFHTHCENCGTRLDGPWCHRCGQHDFEFHRSFWHVFLEALETVFHFEGKFFRNIVTLLFQPGRLTAEFNAGKRAPQMPPFRLYIFVSFVFFLLIFLDGGSDAVSLRSSITDDTVPDAARIGAAWQEATSGMKDSDWHDPAKVERAIQQAAAAALPAGNAPETEAARRQLAAELGALADQAAAAPAAKRRPPDQSDLAHHLLEQVRRMNDRGHRERLINSIKGHLPHLLMFCLPLFALYTRVLFRKAGFVYLQHLVLAVHFHTFIYLWLLCSRGWVGLAGLPGWALGDWVAFLCTAWLYVYPCLMLRRLFANPWPRTIAKSCVLALVYALTLGLGFVAMALATFLLA